MIKCFFVFIFSISVVSCVPVMDAADRRLQVYNMTESTLIISVDSSELPAKVIGPSLQNVRANKIERVVPCINCSWEELFEKTDRFIFHLKLEDDEICDSALVLNSSILDSLKKESFMLTVKRNIAPGVNNAE